MEKDTLDVRDIRKVLAMLSSIVVYDSYWVKNIYGEKKREGQMLEWNGVYTSRVFLEFQYLRVSINTLLRNLNFDTVKVFFPILVDIGILPNHVKISVFYFVFSNLFIRNPS